MSEVEFVKNLLEANWQTSITNRSQDVPDPAADEIVWTLEKSESNARLRNRDVGYVVSAGDTNYTPLGFGWTHQTIDTVVAIEYRAAANADITGYTDPYNRLHGQRTGGNGLGAPDRWDGVIGETTRVLQAERKGISEWDTVGVNDLRVVDNIDTGGKNYYRADVLVDLRNIADSIDTST